MNKILIRALLFLLIIIVSCFQYTYSQKDPYSNEIHYIKEYIKNKFKSPSYVVDDSIQGTVYVKFTVNDIGYIRDVELIKGIRNDIDSFCIDFIKRMPKCPPRSSSIHATKVVYTLPLTIRLNEETE